MPLKLTVKQRTFLKSLAHHHKPVVWIGKNGLDETVLDAIDAALLHGELIKVKVLEAAPVDRKAVGAPIAEALGCVVVQVIGRMVVLYRPHPEKPKLKLPPAATKSTPKEA